MAKPSMIQQGVRRGVNFIRHVVPAVIRPIHSLWHQIIGFLFLVLAAWPVPAGIRTIRDLDTGKGSLMKLILIVVFVTIMAGYGISSFRRASKISRS